jgi:hypothetical protein
MNQGFPTIPVITKLLIANNYLYACTLGYSVWRRPLSDFIGIRKISSLITSDFFLSQNFPNPFNPSTKIRFDIQKSCFVSLRIYNSQGREISTIVNETLSPGTYENNFDASEFPSGIYFYRLQSDIFSDTKKMILIK